MAIVTLLEGETRILMLGAQGISFLKGIPKRVSPNIAAACRKANSLRSTPLFLVDDATPDITPGVGLIDPRASGIVQTTLEAL